MARYRFNPETKQVEPIGAEWSDVESQAPVKTEELSFGGLRATDGTDISSRKKRREYMQRNGLSDVSDFTDTWAKAAKEREQFRSGQAVNPERREALGRIAYQMEQKRRRR